MTEGSNSPAAPKSRSEVRSSSSTSSRTARDRPDMTWILCQLSPRDLLTSYPQTHSHRRNSRSTWSGTRFVQRLQLRKPEHGFSRSWALGRMTRSMYPQGPQPGPRRMKVTPPTATKNPSTAEMRTSKVSLPKSRRLLLSVRHPKLLRRDLCALGVRCSLRHPHPDLDRPVHLAPH